MDDIVLQTARFFCFLYSFDDIFSLWNTNRGEITQFKLQADPFSYRRVTSWRWLCQTAELLGPKNGQHKVGGFG